MYHFSGIIRDQWGRGFFEASLVVSARTSPNSQVHVPRSGMGQIMVFYVQAAALEITGTKLQNCPTYYAACKAYS